MTEAAIITIAIVAGIVGLFWVVIHYACKLQANERRQQQKGGDYSVQVQTSGDLDIADWPLTEQQAARLRHFGSN